MLNREQLEERLPAEVLGQLENEIEAGEEVYGEEQSERDFRMLDDAVDAMLAGLEEGSRWSFQHLDAILEDTAAYRRLDKGGFDPRKHIRDRSERRKNKRARRKAAGNGAAAQPLDLTGKTAISGAEVMARQEKLRVAEGDAAGEPHPYGEDGGAIWFYRGETPVRLTNFTARIVEALTHDDGAETTVMWRIEVRRGGLARTVGVDPAEFHRMLWPGMANPDAVVMAGKTAKDHAGPAIRLLSVPVPERTVYAHTGWRTIDGRPVFLHAGGAIGAEGSVGGIECDPGEALAGYRIGLPADAAELGEAVGASLAMIDAGAEALTLPLLGAAYVPLLTRPRFTIFFKGESGTYKSSAVALMMGHYGTTFTYDHLPANFNSTGNYLLHLAHATADVVLPLDDYAPGADRRAAVTARGVLEHVARSAGNAAGRGRLDRDGRMRPERMPRGLIMITGETADGLTQSIYARMLLLPVGRGDLSLDTIMARTRDHAARGLLGKATGAFVRWIAADPSDRRTRFNAHYRTAFEAAAAKNAGGHARSPDAVATLIAALRLLGEFAREAADVDPGADWDRRVTDALLGHLAGQAERQAGSSPEALFLDALRGAVAGGRAHLGDYHRAELEGPAGSMSAWLAYGWRVAGVSSVGDKAGGTKAVERLEPRTGTSSLIGYVRQDRDRVYLLPEPAHRVAREELRRTGRELPRDEDAIRDLLAERRLLVDGTGASVSANPRLPDPETGEKKRQRVWALKLDDFLPPRPTLPSVQKEAGDAS